MIEENVNDFGSEKTPNLSRGKLGFMLTGLGVGGVLAYLISRSARQTKQPASGPDRHGSDNVVDDQGTTQEEAAMILRNLRDRGFESSDEKVAVALGRTSDEIHMLCSGLEPIDDDVIMKARGIAMHRGIRID
jgi:hypothetical protein